MFRYLLFPFAVLYHLVTAARNYLYDIGHKRQVEFTRFVIGVGNLRVGGSGKTPMIEYLVHRLHPGFRLAILSRGYGRTSRGFKVASPADEAASLGDEPFQMYRKFGNFLPVVVAEDRALAIPSVLLHYPDTEVLLLDDAFQHRSVKPQFSILLTEFDRPFYHDHVMPLGRLREARTGANRADVVVVTKCPASLSAQAQADITQSVQRFAGTRPVFFAGIRYQRPMPFHGPLTSIERQPLVLLSGIANPQPFESYARTKFIVAHHHIYPDHYRYRLRDVKEIAARIQPGQVLLTTEKDMVRLLQPSLRAALNNVPCFFLPIEMKFLNNGSVFEEMITAAVRNFKP
jgi:tetraacyldisaccharide 4'-kinase